jgi:dimethylargininase
VRPPAPNFADGLSSSGLGAPLHGKAQEQHARYCEALEQCGLTLTRLAPDSRYPDGTFVEDDAILTPHAAILTRPGAESRQGEVAEIREVLARFYPSLHSIEAPGTLDGGDICEAGDRFFIGISQRTNEEGARRLAGFLEKEGYRCTFVNIRQTPGILHLKSGIACVGDGRLVLIDALMGREEFRRYEVVRVEESEGYAANCVRVNDAVLMAAGYPKLAKSLSGLGYRVIPLEMSEYRKMDGGLSCLSLRF